MAEICVVCGAPFANASDDFPDSCSTCESLLPASLIKACRDEYMYELKLRTGEVIQFNYAEIHGSFAHLCEAYIVGSDDEARYRGRGIDVMISEIVWCADLGN